MYGPCLLVMQCAHSDTSHSHVLRTFLNVHVTVFPILDESKEFILDIGFYCVAPDFYQAW